MRWYFKQVRMRRTATDTIGIWNGILWIRATDLGQAKKKMRKVADRFRKEFEDGANRFLVGRIYGPCPNLKIAKEHAKEVGIS